jgi:LysM repeat protein
VVEKGQTLSLIAEGFGTTVPKILAANPGLKPNLLRVGQKLIIPAEDVPQQPKKGRGKR